MGIKDSKAQKVGADAQAAWDAGYWVFTPVLNFPMFNMGFSGGNDDIAMMVHEILRVGWKLDTWSATEAGGKAQIMPLFVRPGATIRV